MLPSVLFVTKRRKKSAAWLCKVGGEGGVKGYFHSVKKIGQGRASFSLMCETCIKPVYD